MPEPTIPISVAKAMADRLAVWKRLHAYHREVGDTEVNLPIEDLWSPADAAAMDAWEAYLKERAGERPLPM